MRMQRPHGKAYRMKSLPQPRVIARLNIVLSPPSLQPRTPPVELVNLQASNGSSDQILAIFSSVQSIKFSMQQSAEATLKSQFPAGDEQ